MKKKLIYGVLMYSICSVFCLEVNAQTIGDTFTENGIEYEVTVVGIPNEVSAVDYTGINPGVAIPSAVVDSGTSFSYDVTAIGNQAFFNNSLVGVIIPDGITSIGSGAFQNNSLPSLTIPSSVTSIGTGAFSNNSTLTTVVSESTSPATLLSFTFNNNSAIDLTIPVGSEQVYLDAKWLNFRTYNSVDLNFTIGDLEYQITHITNTEVSVVDYAVTNTVAIIPLTVTDPSTSVSYEVTSISDYALRNNSLINVTIGDNVTYIGTYAFLNNSLTSVTIGNSVTTIAEGAFQNNSLTSVTIPNNVTTLGDFVFRNNTSLTNVVSESTNPPALPANFFHNKSIINLSIPSGTTLAYTNANWTGFNSITTYTYWTGATDNDWHDVTNWVSGAVPIITEDVTIPAGLTNYPTSTTDVYFNNLTIEAGATYIPEGFVNIGGVVNAKINIPDTNWHLIAPPVLNGVLEDFITGHSFATGTGTNIGLASYNITSDTWNYFNASSTGFTPVTEGMSIKLAAAGDITFRGIVNQSDYGAALYSGSGTNYNLIGNPYTSYVNSGTFLSDTNTQLSQQTIWLWNGTSYQTHNLLNPLEIAPGQGFFVEFDPASIFNITVNFSTANRSHQSTNTFLRQEPTTNFELFVNNGNQEVSTKVFYVANKTTGFDNGYDSSMFGGANKGLAVYTELLSDNQGEKLAIQTLPSDKVTNMVIPVGVIANANEEITFSVASLNLPEDVEIYLQDTVNNHFINLTETSYKTTLENKSEGVGQFYVHTSAKSLSTNDDVLALNVNVYQSSSSELTITGLQTEAKVSLFSLTGKEMINTKIISRGNSKINLPSVSIGIYLVKIATTDGIVSKKITLK